MPIAISTLTVGQSTAADPSTASITPTVGTDTMVMVWVGASYASAQFKSDLLSVAGGSGTWTKVNTGRWADRRRSWLWVCRDWSGTGAITFTFTGTDPQQWTWIVEEATGLHETVPYDPIITSYYLTVGQEASPVDLSPTISPDTNDVVYSCVHLENNYTDLDCSGYTASTETALGTLGVRRAETAYALSDPSTVWSWGTGNAGFGGVTITLKAPGAVITTPPFFEQTAGDWGITLSATFGVPPTEGNLLLAVLLEREPSPQGTPSMTTAGYTLIDTERFYDADSTHRRGCSIYYKVAGASESATVEGNWSPTSSNNAIYIAEISNIGSYRSNFGYSDNGNVLDETVFTSDGLTTSSDSAIVAFTFYKGQASSPTADLSVTYGGDFISAPAYGAAGSYTFGIGAGVVEKVSGGSYSATSTLTATDTSNRDITNVLIEFASINTTPSSNVYPEYARILTIS